jgi:hypothetical protein
VSDVDEFCGWCEECQRLSGEKWLRCLRHWHTLTNPDGMIWSCLLDALDGSHVGGEWCWPPGLPMRPEQLRSDRELLESARRALAEIDALVARPVQLTIGETAAVRAAAKTGLRASWSPPLDATDPTYQPDPGDRRRWPVGHPLGTPLPWTSKGVEERDRRGDVGLHATVAFPERGGPWS